MWTPFTDSLLSSIALPNIELLEFRDKFDSKMDKLDKSFL
jgi:hypothetical protein